MFNAVAFHILGSCGVHEVLKMENAKPTEQFNLPELLEFFRPHTIRLNGTSTQVRPSACNLVPMKLQLLSVAWVTKHKQTPTLYKVDGYSEHPERDTLTAIERGIDIIAGAVLPSVNALVRAPFLVRKPLFWDERLPDRNHYEVWDCTAESPSDPILLLELYAAAEALHRHTGVMAPHVHIAVFNGPQLAFNTTELGQAFDEVRRLFTSSRATAVRSTTSNRVLRFRQRKTQDIQ